MKSIGLIDCNSFYASCEKVFRPDLKNKPVVVLSNNDGCVVAMSPEAKRLGIPRGIPYFKAKPFLEANNVHVFSSNYELYADLSKRVMSIIKEQVPGFEQYSIDEAFFEISGLTENLDEFCHRLRSNIYQWTGIPTSIGLSLTKVLAKLANSRAKKTPHGLFFLGPFSFHTTKATGMKNIQQVLHETPVGAIWGISHRTEYKLKAKGIFTAADLTEAEDSWIKSKLTITGLRIVQELRGQETLFFEDIVPKKEIQCSKSFNSPVSSLNHLKEAVTDYVLNAFIKLRGQKSYCGSLAVFLTTTTINNSFRVRTLTREFTFLSPTHYLPELTEAACKLVTELYDKNTCYRKVTVQLGNLCTAEKAQNHLFHALDNRRDEVMNAVAKVDQKYGKKTLHCGVIKERSAWEMKRNMLSPRYTTCWKELPVVRV